MHARYAKALLSLAAAAALALPASALARHGADDGPHHVRQEHRHVRHHHVAHHGRHLGDDHGRHGGGTDDGPTHR